MHILIYIYKGAFNVEVNFLLSYITHVDRVDLKGDCMNKPSRANIPFLGDCFRDVHLTQADPV